MRGLLYCWSLLWAAAAAEHCVFQCLHETEWGRKYREAHPYHEQPDERQREMEQSLAAHGSRPCGIEKPLKRAGMCAHCTRWGAVAAAAVAMRRCVCARCVCARAAGRAGGVLA